MQLKLLRKKSGGDWLGMTNIAEGCLRREFGCRTCDREVSSHGGDAIQYFELSQAPPPNMPCGIFLLVGWGFTPAVRASARKNRNKMKTGLKLSPVFFLKRFLH